MEKGVAQRRSAQAKRGRLGSGLRARAGLAPLAVFAVAVAFQQIRAPLLRRPIAA